MFDRLYRRRLLQDLSRWEATGAVSPDGTAAVRAALGPGPQGVGVASLVAIAATLLLAAALLAFVASNWNGIDRPLRMALLLGLIAAAYASGAVFCHRHKPLLADLAAFLGTIGFVASIALVGQMYHLPKDLAGGFLLCAIGSLVAAGLTVSTGAFTIALVSAIAWSASAMATDWPHWPFLGLWAAAGGLAIGLARASYRHLVGAAASAWVLAIWASRVSVFAGAPETAGHFTASCAIVLFLGVGALCAASGRDRPRAFGETLSNYMSFALVGAVVLGITESDLAWRRAPAALSAMGLPHALLATGLAALGIAAVVPRTRVLAIAIVAASAGAIALFVLPIDAADFRLRGGLGLLVSAALIAGGAYAARRPILVAGWTGFALVVGHLTWFAAQSLRERSVFLALAGLAAIAAALILRHLPRPSRGTP